MNHVLDNPVYHALTSRDAHLGSVAGNVRYFDAEVSPFAGFPINYRDGFKELYRILPPGRRILYASTTPIDETGEWTTVAYIKGSQFVFDKKVPVETSGMEPVPLSAAHVDEMLQLAALTKPGPFDKRTIEFGNYFGFFESGKLVAMTGQRLHVDGYSEISAVCTHPDALGKGYATALIRQQLTLINNEGNTPFLHVREDNARAIAVYERLGFRLRGPMHFYFLKRKD